jgi:hypothetical protein
MGELAMLMLSSQGLASRNLSATTARMVMRVSDQRARPRPLRLREAYLATNDDLPDGFGLYLALAKDAAVLSGLPSHVKHWSYRMS